MNTMNPSLLTVTCKQQLSGENAFIIYGNYSNDVCVPLVKFHTDTPEAERFAFRLTREISDVLACKLVKNYWKSDEAKEINDYFEQKWRQLEEELEEEESEEDKENRQ